MSTHRVRRSPRTGAVAMAAGPWTTVEGGGQPRVASGGPGWNASCTACTSSHGSRFDVKPSQHRPRSLALRLGALGMLVLAACDLGERFEDAVEQTVVTRSAGAVSTKTNFALVSEVFSGEPELATLDVVAARARAVELLDGRLRSLNVVGCQPSLVSDPVAGTVDAEVDGCRVGLVHLDGELHAEVEIETAPCDAGECPSAVVWRLDDASDISIGAALVRPRLRGSVTFRDPVDASLPMTWETGPDFVLENAFGEFSTRSSASWFVDDARCVHDMQLEARLVRVDSDDDDDNEREVGTIVVAAKGLDRCPARCPTAGSVILSFAGGRVLHWDYAGRDVDVFAPRGRRFEAQLDCNE